MKRPMSLSLRITLLFGISAALVLTVFGWTINNTIESHFASEDSSELEAVAAVVEKSLATLPAADQLSHIQQHFTDLLSAHRGTMLHITDASGRTLYASPGPDVAALPVADGTPREDIQEWQDSAHRYRVLRRTRAIEQELYTSPLTIVVAIAIDYHLHLLQRLRQTLWYMVAGAIVVTGILGWLTVRQGHKPLHQIVEQIQHISAQELHTRLLPESVPAELTELANSCNALLQRMQQAFVQLSNFSDDIAHELRTPVTVLMTQTQVALSQIRSAEAYREVLYSNMEEYERLAQMIGDMLFLAKTSNKLDAQIMAEVDLGAEVHSLFDYYEAWADERGITLAVTGDGSVRGDRLMLRRALSNLLSNAIRHTPAQQSVTVHLDSNGHTRISVRNPGAPIPAQHLDRLFDRFYRIDPSRQRSGEGTGLGLAIVKAIAQAHHGSIHVSSDVAYTQFTLVLPRTGACLD